MDNSIESVSSNSVDVVNLDSLSDTSVLDSSDESDKLLLIRENPIDLNDVICRRNLNNMYGTRYTIDCDNIQHCTASTVRIMRQSANKSFKRFLFLFGFVSTIVTISLYLSMYYEEPIVQGE